MSYDLEVLSLNRRGLWLAEAAALLHDMGKCADEMLVMAASDRPANLGYNYKTAQLHRVDAKLTVDLLGESIPMRELIDRGRPAAVSDSAELWLVRGLGRCHAAAHVEKEDPTGGKQKAADTRLATAFGHEREPLAGLSHRLDTLPLNPLGERADLVPALRGAFGDTFGDSRRPVNEVTLWDWSHTVSAMYKAALAKSLLVNTRLDPISFSWRLLSVRFDGLEAISRSPSLPVLAARQRWLREALDSITRLLEEAHPLGTEIFRDENGSVYVVPDLPNLLSLTCEGGMPLERRIVETLGLEGELVPAIRLDQEAWRGSGPREQQVPKWNEVPPIAHHLREPEPLCAAPAAVSAWWKHASGSEACIASGVRPQGPGQESKGRKLSDYWLDRSRGRTSDWLQDQSATIWLDEVADRAGRVCLLVGRLGLEGWLEADGYIESLLVDPPDGAKKAISKNPSFARVRRFWGTTKRFWEDVDATITASQRVNGRARIRGNASGFTGKLTPNLAYEAHVLGSSLSVVCEAVEGDMVSLLLVENPENSARLLGATRREIESAGGGLGFVTQVVERQSSLDIRRPGGYGAVGLSIGTLAVESCESTEVAYAPAISILAEPAIFMALVPADRCQAAVSGIRDKYDRELGKLRNRLPLVLGLVFGHAHTPLDALLDAGHRMLRGGRKAEEWTVIQPRPQQDSAGFRLRKNGAELAFLIPTVMGDKTTQDTWYPQWQLSAGGVGRRSSFTGPGGSEWAHVKGLRDGDRVSFQPSRFDFEFLDTTSRRFEISYDGDGGRRGSSAPARPYYLEQLDDLSKIWKLLRGGLSTSQIKGLQGLLTAKREQWGTTGAEALERLAGEALSNAGWQQGRRPGTDDMELLRLAAVSGMLDDVIELYMTVGWDGGDGSAAGDEEQSGIEEKAS
jgi:hypothetical protein